MIVLNILWNYFKVVKKVICQDKGVMFWFLGVFFLLGDIYYRVYVIWFFEIVF